MKLSRIVVSALVLGSLGNHALAQEDDSNVYVGAGLSSLALDDDRIAAYSTRSPSHTPKLFNLSVGYQFNSAWSADLTVGTDMDYERGVDRISVNAYRFFGTNWRPFVSAGFSSVDTETSVPESTESLQAGIGVSKDFTRNLEMRVGWQHFYAFDDEGHNDDEYSIALNWHFRKPLPPPAAAPEPAPVAAPAPAPAPEPAPVEKVVVDTFELLVQFEFDHFNVRSIYRPQMEEIAQIMKDYPDSDLTIEGHTCTIGPEEYNQTLSENRANAVRDIFINELGIDPSRISAQGFGESVPVADNGTREGREANRRALGVLRRPRVVTE